MAIITIHWLTKIYLSWFYILDLHKVVWRAARGQVL